MCRAAVEESAPAKKAKVASVLDADTYGTAYHPKSRETKLAYRALLLYIQVWYSAFCCNAAGLHIPCKGLTSKIADRDSGIFLLSYGKQSSVTRDLPKLLIQNGSCSCSAACGGF